MLKNINYQHNIIFPLLIPWDQCADFQKQTVNYIKKNNNCFVYLAGDKKIFVKVHKCKNILFFYPIKSFINLKIVQMIFEKVNLFLFRLVVKKHLEEQESIDIVWIFNPELNNFFKYFHQAKIKIYDFVDFSDLKSMYLIIKKANLVFANSTVLKRFVDSIDQKKAIIVPQGFDLETFDKKLSLLPKNKKKKVTISYIGSINFRLDFSLLLNLIQDNQQYDFIFWGPIQYLNRNLDKIYDVKNNIRKLKKYKNVKFGQSDRNGVIEILKNTTIGIVPYNTHLDFNRNCFPMKVIEYFYMGLPILSTGIEELYNYKKIIHISNNSKDWNKYINEIVNKGWPKEKSALERKIAISHNWTAKMKKVESTINNFSEKNNN